MRSFAVSLFIVFGIFVITSPVFAAGLVPCEGPDCQACHVVQLGQKVIEWFIGIAASITALVFVIGGLKMVMAGGDTGSVSSARQMMTNAVVGFVILLSAWLIINTVLKIFVSNSSSLQGVAEMPGYGPWNEIQCVAQPQRTTTQTTAPVTTTPGTGATGTTNTNSVSHSDALRRLESVSNVNVTSTNGESGVRADCSGHGCTTLEGIREQTVSQVLEIASECPRCQINVVGATEGGVHSSGGGATHTNGFKVDIDDNPEVDTFLESRLTRAGSTSLGPRYTDSCGNTYVRENTHWDITVSRGTCSI